MAIARDATSTAVASLTNGTTVINTLTTGGSSTLLIALVEDQNGTADNIVGVTANASSMTRWASFAGTSENRFLTIYALVSPSTSTSYTITATRSSGSFKICMQSAAYSGTALTNAADATATQNSPSGTSTSTTITTVANNCWIVSVADGGAISGTSNFTQLGTVEDVFFADSNASVSAGANTVSFSHASGTATLLSASIAPPVVAANSAFLMFM